MAVDVTVDPREPTGGTIKVPAKKLALKQIADIKKSLDQLQKTVNSIDEVKPVRIPPKPKAKAAKV